MRIKTRFNAQKLNADGTERLGTDNYRTGSYISISNFIRHQLSKPHERGTWQITWTKNGLPCSVRIESKQTNNTQDN